MATNSKTTEKVIVTQESETRIRTLQSNLVALCVKYKKSHQLIQDTPPGQLQKRLQLQQDLGRIQTEIMTLDRHMKQEIKRGTIAPECSKFSVRLQRRSFRGRKSSTSNPTKIPQDCSIHPSTNVKKEEFLDGLGLMSQEALQMRKLQSGKVERRRRTANTNPKYSSNGFLKFDELSTRRSKRLEAVSGDVSSSSTSSGSGVTIAPSYPLQIPIQSCYVCYGTDFDLSCETCTTKLHADCIKVTASNAPTPHRLPICPKCVQAANTSQRVRMQSRNSRPPPSIFMQSPTKQPGGLLKYEGDGDVQDEDNTLEIPMTTSNRSSKVKRSNSTSEVEDKNNHFRNYGSSRKQIEAVGPKAKMYNGGGQSKAVRIARVRLNMRRSSEEPSGQTPTTVAAPTPFTRSKTPQSTKQSTIRWQNKLKPKQIRTYGRKRLPVTRISSDAPPHICVDTQCELCLVTETRNHEEDEENALLIHQSVGVCPTIKTEKINGADQQSPLVIKNNNDVNMSEQQYNSNNGSIGPPFKVMRTPKTASSCPKKSARNICKRTADSASLPHSNNSVIMVTNGPVDVSPSHGPKKKRGDRASKAKAEHAIVIKKTMIAMNAAAATVMSNPMKCALEEDDPWKYDTINQSISSVIAWACRVNEDESEVNIDGSVPFSSDPIPLVVSPSMLNCELNEEEMQHSENGNDDEEEYNQMMPPDNLSINGEADLMTSEDGKSNISASCSMKGQLSDDDDESETLLSIGNSPAPSWADGDTMSRSELVEKMLENTDQQQELKKVIPASITTAESKS